MLLFLHKMVLVQMTKSTAYITLNHRFRVTQKLRALGQIFFKVFFFAAEAEHFYFSAYAC